MYVLGEIPAHTELTVPQELRVERERKLLASHVLHVAFLQLIVAASYLGVEPKVLRQPVKSEPPRYVEPLTLALYLLEHGTNPFILGRTKYAQQIARMTGQSEYMSSAMKDDFNRYGLVNFIDGVRVAHIPSVLPDGKVFGIADKIGTLDMRGSLRMYETFDNTAEKVDLKLTGFEYGFMIANPENICKLTIQ